MNINKKYFSNQKGITLLALVITIIVLIILASISLRKLNERNGVIKQATFAKDSARGSEVQETIDTEVVNNEHREFAGKDKKTREQVINELHQKRKLTDDEVEQLQETNTIKIGGVTVDFSELGTVSGGDSSEGGDSSDKWTQDSEGKIVSPDGKVKLQIGDYVNYNALAGVDTTDSNNTTIKSNGTDNGYGDQTFDLTKYTGDNKWRVLGVKDGKVELISANLVPLSDNSVYFYLKGRTGFQNAETELTKIAGLYGHGTYATGARSVNVNDINKITGYNPKAEGIKNPTAEQITSGNKYGKNELNEYGNEVTFSWVGSDKPKYEATNGKTGNLSQSHNEFFWYDFNTNNWKKSTYTTNATETSPVEITNLTSSYYRYFPETLSTSYDTNATTGIANSSTERKMLFINDRYWLASRCLSQTSYWTSYFVRYVDVGSVNVYGLVDSRGYEMTSYVGVRPVVSLSSDIQLEPNGTNAWKFKQ